MEIQIDRQHHPDLCTDLCAGNRTSPLALPIKQRPNEPFCPLHFQILPVLILPLQTSFAA